MALRNAKVGPDGRSVCDDVSIVSRIDAFTLSEMELNDGAGNRGNEFVGSQRIVGLHESEDLTGFYLVAQSPGDGLGHSGETGTHMGRLI